MKSSCRLYFVIILTSAIASGAMGQNRYYDWSIGVHPSIYSFSAVRNNAISSPYEYHRAMSVSFSRYLNRHLDIAIEAGRSNVVRYPIGDFVVPDSQREWDYEQSKFYDTHFSLRYKLDNGYILAEHFAVAPFIKIGFGMNKAEVGMEYEYFVPAGVGVNIAMNKRTTFSYQATYKHSLQSPRNYMQHSVGINVNFGETSYTRIAQTRKREKQRKAEQIAKAREKRATERAKIARERLADAPPAYVRPASSNTTRTPEDPEIMDATDVSETTAMAAVVTTPTTTTPPPPVVDVAPTISLPPPPVSTVSEEKIPPMPKTTSAATPIPTDTNTATATFLPPQPRPSIPDFIRTNTPTPVNATPVVNTTPPSTPPKIEAPKPRYDETSKYYCYDSDKQISEIGQRISFDEGSTHLRAGNLTALAEIVKIMNKCPDMSYVVKAHGDETSTEASNKAIAHKRATAIRDHITSKGIATDRVVLAAFGDYFLPSSGADKRIAFKINYKVAIE